jgi:hypothetical protein
MPKKAPGKIEPSGNTAIGLGPGVKNVRFENVKIVGFDTGILAAEGSSFTASGMHFDRVGQPYDVRGAAKAEISNTRITNDPKHNHGRPNSPSHSKKSSPPLPAYCDNCKTIFASKNYKLYGKYFSLLNNEETCPECGSEHAKLSEGIFDLTREFITIILAPDVTHLMINELIIKLNQKLNGEKTENQIQDDIYKFFPSINELIAKFLKIGNSAIILALTIEVARFV